MRALIARPLPLAAVAVLAFNDHVAKRMWPGVVTGKVSDVAGLFFFPVLVATLARFVAPRSRVAGASAVATAVVFAAIKIVPAANAIANRVLGPTVLDPTDLWALPACLLAWLYIRNDSVHVERAITGFDRLAVAVAGLASMATSPIRRPACPAGPARPPHITWDSTCLRTPGAKVVLSSKRLELELPLRPAASACVFDARAIMVDYDAVSSHVRMKANVPTGTRVEQELVVRATFELPYPTRCDALHVSAVVPGAPTVVDVDTHIASCTEAP